MTFGPKAFFTLRKRMNGSPIRFDVAVADRSPPWVTP